MKDIISENEKEKRRNNVKYAIASCELEGCIIPQGHKEISERYIKGEITALAAGELMRQDLHQWESRLAPAGIKTCTSGNHSNTNISNTKYNK